MNFYVIILAAGKGTRMQNEAAPVEFPKVLRKACGRPLIYYIIDTLHQVKVSDINIIVGFGAQQVKAALGKSYHFILQSSQLGSGHAVACAKDTMRDRTGHALVMCGDSPLFTPGTIRTLMKKHSESHAVITLVSATLDDPSGYGRIKRLPSNEIIAVVEEKCASPEEKAIHEINGGAYAFDSKWLWENIERIEQNETGEFNLTELVKIAAAQGRCVEAVQSVPEEVMGVNTPEELAAVEHILCRRAEIKQYRS